MPRLLFKGQCALHLRLRLATDFCVLQVTIMTDLSSAFDKGCTLVFTVVGGVAAATVLTLCPQAVLTFNTQAASAALSHATGSLLRNKAATEAGKVHRSNLYSCASRPPHVLDLFWCACQSLSHCAEQAQYLAACIRLQ